MFTGPLDPQHQVHDFNPGIAPSGLFWTVAVPRSSVDTHLGSGRASLHVSNLEVEDYHDVINALMDGPSTEAHVSFNIQWSGITKRVKTRDTAKHFAGEFVENTATIEWSATGPAGNYRSDPAATSTSEFAEIGHERNGRFFPQGS